MEFTAQQIAELIKGKIEGDPEVKINNLSKIDEGKPNTISFLANPKYTPYIYSTQASVVIVHENFKAEKEVKPTLIRVKDAYHAFAKLLETYNKIKLDKKGISDKAFIHDTATIGQDVYIGEFACISGNAQIGNNSKIYPQVYIGENVKIGDNTTLFPGVKVYSDNNIGNNCSIHAGVIIGSDGFGFAPKNDDNYLKVSQIGNVIIEDDVEIGSNTTIDRATLGSTIIRKGVKLDNLIQVAHNVEIGENTVVVSQTGIAGSTKIGKNCMIGGQVGIIGHLNIADNVKIAAQSGIQANIEEGKIVQGSPAFDVRDYRRSYVMFRQLPDWRENITALKKELEALSEKKE